MNHTTYVILLHLGILATIILGFVLMFVLFILLHWGVDELADYLERKHSNGKRRT